MKIEIWSDFACPFCYLGKKKLEKAIAAFPHKENIEVIYKAYELSPNLTEDSNLVGIDGFVKTKGVEREQAVQSFAGITNAAKAYGLNYQMDKIKMVKTYKAHRLAKWANTHNLEAELSELLFDAYFIKGENLADNDLLLSLVDKLGLNRNDALKVLESNEFSDVVDAQISESRRFGVRGVPFFVFNRKFAVSGAQSDEHFTSALQQAYEEENTFEVIGDEGADACGPNGCDI